MKSIMEEASSIFKAIEKGWNSAGQPKEFTVKIFEEPQKNFIGMTVRPAKIGIFFTESPQQRSGDQQQAKKRRTGPQEERTKPADTSAQARGQRTRTPRIKETPATEGRSQEQQSRTEQSRPERTRIDRTEQSRGEQACLDGRPAETEPKGPIWTDEMMDTVKRWVTEMLPSMNLDHVSFTVNPQHFHLKIQFADNFYDDKNRQKYLFANLSNLLLTMLKRHYKRPLKGYKIVLLVCQW